MDLNKLASRVFTYGRFIAVIEYYNRRIALYSVDKDFYEVYYDAEENQVEKISEASEQDLTKFLTRITLKF